MDRYYSLAISKESSDVYSIPNSTQHDARQRCPALIVLKEENNNNNNVRCKIDHVAQHYQYCKANGHISILCLFTECNC